MKDYRIRIQDRASILDITLNKEQLAVLNQQVNDKIANGLHKFDALDYAYFILYLVNEDISNHISSFGATTEQTEKALRVFNS